MAATAASTNPATNNRFPSSGTSGRAQGSSSASREPEHHERLSADQVVRHDEGGIHGSHGGGASIEAQMIQQGPIELSAEQQFLIKQVIENKKSVFFTGSAGTGKSVLLRHLIEELKMHYLPGNVAVTASTGIAACNIGGCTLHGFAGVGLGTGSVDQLVKKILEKKQARARWRKTKVLIIDEISMIPGDLFDKLEEIARVLKKSQKPFGGIQLIITGDFFQLPPVAKQAILPPVQQPKAPPPQPSITQKRTTTVIKAEDIAKMQDEDDLEFFLEKDLNIVDHYPKAPEHGIIPDPLMMAEEDEEDENEWGAVDSLDSNGVAPPSFSDDPFAPPLSSSSSSSTPSPLQELLAPVAEPEEQKLCFESRAWQECIDYTLQLTEVFRQRDPVFIKMLTEMRQGQVSEETCRVFRKLQRTPSYADDGIRPTELYALRRQVEAANHRYLAELPGALYIYEPQDSGPLASLMDKHSIAPSVLQLKENAQVMLIKNLSPTLVNGSMGIVVGFHREVTYADNGALVESHFPIVRFPSEAVDYVVRPEEWKMEMPNGQVIASRIQVPLILAWAISIHKSQGQTMERVKVDMGNIFEAGQAYVALSRATSLAGLQVLNFDRRVVQADERVAAFYKGLETVKELMDREAAKAEGRKKRSAARKKRRAAKTAATETMAATTSSTLEQSVLDRPIDANPNTLADTAQVAGLGAEHTKDVQQHAQWLELEKKKWLEEAKKQWLEELEEQRRQHTEDSQSRVADGKSTTPVVSSPVATEVEEKVVAEEEKTEPKLTRKAQEDLSATVPAVTTTAEVLSSASASTVVPPNKAMSSASLLPTSPASKFQETAPAPGEPKVSASTITTNDGQAAKTSRAEDSQQKGAVQQEKPPLKRSWRTTVTIIKAKDIKGRKP